MWYGFGFLAFVGLAIWLSVRDQRRKARRRATLRQDGSTWIWIDFDGSTRRSDIHPERPGGDWYSDGGSDSGSDGGDGGD
ncbi:hypothetical protein KUV73_19765 [Mameliella alba]|nr:hypothetical protein [Mameliella alba]MBY6171393.1 hypothetical protein [Mameliella alba]MBY6176617.1 hypothetical protein [Mameliella alba]